MNRLLRDNISVFLAAERLVIGDPVISIVIPTRFREKHLNNCLDAIKSNSSIDHEVIIVRDENKDRVGCANAVNVGTHMCDTDIIVFIGNDTLPQPGWDTNALDCLAEFNNSIGMVGFNDTVTDYNEKPAPQHFMIHKEIIKKLPNQKLFYNYHHNYCDVELHHRVNEMGLYNMCDTAIIYHIHHMIAPEGHSPREPDECDLFAYENAGIDMKVCQSRIG